MCPEIWHCEQAEVVHQLDVHKDERQHFELYAEHLLAQT